MNDTARSVVITQARADVLHIGYPKAASTFIVRFLENHPEITMDHYLLSDLLQTHAEFALSEKPCANKVHVSKDENIAESVCIVGTLENWQRYLYVPGAWDSVKNDVVVSPWAAAARLHKVHPRAKVLVLIREQADWLQSVYKYVISQLPWDRRSFADYCSTPSGIVHLNAGHFDQTISAYIDVFGSDRVRVLRFERIVDAPRQFTAELCSFIGVSERPIPQKRENESHAQIAHILRFFPFIQGLPKGVKTALTPYAERLLPGRRANILSSRDIRMLRGMYAASNQRTERLISQLPKQL